MNKRETIAVLLAALATPLLFATAEGEEGGEGTVPHYEYVIIGPAPQAIERSELKHYDEVKAALDEKMAAELGFTIDVTDLSQAGMAVNQLIQLSAAGGDPIHIVQGTGEMGGATEWAPMWIPVEGLVEEHAPDYLELVNDYNPLLLETFSDKDGNLAGLPHLVRMRGLIYLFNQDLIDKLGVELPPLPEGRFDLTFDHLEQLGEAFNREVPDGMGIMWYHTFKTFLGAFEDNISMSNWNPQGYVNYFDQEEGIWKDWVDSEYYEDAVRLFDKFLKKGYYWHSLAEPSGTERDRGFINGTILGRDGQGWYGGNPTYKEWINEDPANETKILVYGVASKKQPIWSAGFRGLFFTKRNTQEQLEKYLQFINWISKDEANYNLARHGIEGLTFEIEQTAGGDTSLHIPESEMTDTIQEPYQLMGFEHRWLLGNYDRRYERAGLTFAGNEIHDLFDALNAQNSTIEPYVFARFVYTPEEQQKVADSFAFITSEFFDGVLMDRDMDVEEKIARGREIYAEFRKMGGGIYIEKTNEYYQANPGLRPLPVN